MTYNDWVMAGVLAVAVWAFLAPNWDTFKTHNFTFDVASPIMIILSVVYFARRWFE